MAEKKTNNKAIPVARFPEQTGVSSAGINALIDDFNENKIELHSIKIIRYGKSAYEAYRHPYNAETPHTMYSVSKSFTSIAIGFAIDEGLLTLDTKVIDIFPEYRPARRDEKLEKMTVFHLLTMTAGKEVSFVVDRTKGRWVKDFFDAKWYAAPGDGWKYISENTYMCSAIITRLTGLTMVDYLTPRLFKPLGIERKPFWESDPAGVNAGGWGLFVTTDELARFVLCLSQGGKYAGEQVIPEWYIKEATSNQTGNNGNTGEDFSNGYGFFFWRNKLENSYRLDGMFSQFGVVLEDYDAVIITTCSEVDEQKTRDCIFRNVPALFVEKSRSKPKDAPELPELSPLDPAEAKPRSVMEEFIKGRIIHFPKNPVLNATGWPLSMLPLAVVFMSADRAGNIDNLVLSFREDECVMTWDEGGIHNSVVCGMDGKERYGKMRLGGIDFTAVCSAAWISDNVIEIRVRALESICERRIELEFKGNTVILYPSSSPQLKTIADNISWAVADMISVKPIADIGVKAVKQLDKILEAPMIGKMY